MTQIKASLFATCIVDQLFPDVGVSVVKILRHLGVEVDFPKGQTCCGQAVFNSGFTKDAAALGKRVLSDFKDSEYIIVPSGSCAAMMKVFYPQLFHDDQHHHQDAQNLSTRVYEFSEFITTILGITDVGATFKKKIAYHPSCHLLRELEVKDGPRELLQNVKEIDLKELQDAEACCGFGGTFSVKYPHISGGMLDKKIDNIIESGAEIITACDTSCLMHMEGSLSRRNTNIQSMHIAQILSEGL